MPSVFVVEPPVMVCLIPAGKILASSGEKSGESVGTSHGASSLFCWALWYQKMRAGLFMNKLN